jgi:hypothetical protein
MTNTITLTRLYGPEEGTTGSITYLLDTPVQVVREHHLYTVRQLSVYSLNDVFVCLEDTEEEVPWMGTNDYWTTLRVLAYGTEQTAELATLGSLLIGALFAAGIAR